MQNTNSRIEIKEKDTQLAQSTFQNRREEQNTQKLEKQLGSITESNQMLATEKELLETKENELHKEVEELWKLKSQYEKECLELREYNRWPHSGAWWYSKKRRNVLKKTYWSQPKRLILKKPLFWTAFA